MDRLAVSIAKRVTPGWHSHPCAIKSADISWSNSLTDRQSKSGTIHEVINRAGKRK